MLLIQAGGLGYMSVTTIVAVALGRQLTVQERLDAPGSEQQRAEHGGGSIRFHVEHLQDDAGVRAGRRARPRAALGRRFGRCQGRVVRALSRRVGLQQCGLLALLRQPDALRGDWIVNLVVCALIIIGGLGFVVLTEVGRRRPLRRLSVHTRLALSMTVILIVGGSVAINALTSGATDGRSVRSALPKRPWRVQAVSPRIARLTTPSTSAP